MRRGASRQGLSADLAGVPVVSDVKELPEKPQVAILCTPTRSVPQYAKEYLAQGINTVDSLSLIHILNDILALCEGVDFSVNVISKSGTTTEPALAFRVFKELLEKSTPSQRARMSFK